MNHIMYPTNDGMPAPLCPEGYDDDESQTVESLYTLVSHNLGNRTFTMSIPMQKFYSISAVANEQTVGDADEVAQRELDPAHAKKLAVYILKGLVARVINTRLEKNLAVPPEFFAMQAVLGKQPYVSLQPFVANLRGRKNYPATRMVTTHGETAGFKVCLTQQDILYVVDGQHRREALRMVFEFLEQARMGVRSKKSLINPADPVTPEEKVLWETCYKDTRGHVSVQVEVHLGLTVEEERQLFYDLNNLGKKVEKAMALSFDSANPINSFVKSLTNIRLSDKDSKSWDDDDGTLLHKDAVAICAHLFLNKTTANGATPKALVDKTHVGVRFWSRIAALPGFGQKSAKKLTVVAQSVFLKALAKLVFDFAFGKQKDPDALDKLLNNLDTVDFSHNNPLWRAHTLTTAELAGFPGLEEYAPNILARDLGTYQGGVIRYSPKHNDVIPVLGDLIRWKLGLPNRHA